MSSGASSSGSPWRSQPDSSALSTSRSSVAPASPSRVGQQVAIGMATERSGTTRLKDLPNAAIGTVSGSTGLSLSVYFAAQGASMRKQNWTRRVPHLPDQRDGRLASSLWCRRRAPHLLVQRQVGPQHRRENLDDLRVL